MAVDLATGTEKTKQYLRSPPLHAYGAFCLPILEVIISRRFDALGRDHHLAFATIFD